MLQGWKLILSNWNNCYFNERGTHEQTLSLESLVNIISHLRDNLDESKSSKLEAHTVSEFIREKYPRFKFENGTVEPAIDNEDEVYLVASLLLFFVCVNSKDIDIKNAMCSKLSGDDQKTILKFSKCLMECPEITYTDVQAAITEACSQDIAAMEVSPRVTVAETPPALRSLHSEVRRLQAALDAERFDRNFLQEELNRTNTKVEKLLKDKQQYKLDILNLKAKISLSSGEGESPNAAAAADRTVKLTRELQQIEEKLIDIQAQLDDVIYERDVYKKKVDELKQERNKYLSLSQQEASRVSQLSEELETERHNVQTLKDLIAELRQHNKLNRFDSSMLECDDPDASIHSLQHNSSMCSEICANVVEVQLGEERAKIVELNQKIQSMQDQLNELNKKTEAEKKSLETIISDRENHIFDLKHRINDEIQEKNNIKAQYDFEITKLNNELNELEQRFKDNRENSRSIIDQKMQEIQGLQEEKLSLIQSLNNKTTQFENIIKDLKNEVETEKSKKANMKDNYEKHIMNLNEKVLNRNNELVELQNSVFEKGEQIETLQLQLKQEKEAKEEINKKHRELIEQKKQVDKDVKQKNKDNKEFQMKLQKNSTIIQDMKDEINNLKQTISELNEKCDNLEEAREELINQVRDRDNRIMEAIKEIEDNARKFNKDNEKLKIDLDEKNAIIQSLQKQLENEIAFKVKLQNELDKMNASIHQVNSLNEQLNLELTKLKADSEDKNKTIDAIDLYLQEEKRSNAVSKEKIEKLTNHIRKKEKEIKQLKDQLDNTNLALTQEIENNKENVEIAQNKLFCETAEKEALQLQLNVLEKECIEMGNLITNKCDEIMVLRAEIGEHAQRIKERDALIRLVEKQFVDECKKYDILESNFEAHMSKVMKRFNKMGKFVVKTTDTLKNEITEKETTIQKLNKHLYHLKEELEITKNDLDRVCNEKDDLSIKLEEKTMREHDVQEKYKCQLELLENLKIKHDNDVKLLTKRVEEKCQDLKQLQAKLDSEAIIKTQLTIEMDSIVKELKGKVSELETIKNELEQKFKTEIDDKTKTIIALKSEIERLQFTIEEDNSNHELIVKENNATIDKLYKEISKKDDKYQDLLATSENFTKNIIQSLEQKSEEIATLNKTVEELQAKINNLEHTNNELRDQIAHTEEINRKVNMQLNEEKALRDTLETEKEQVIKVLLDDKESLIAQKEILSREISDEKSHKKIAEDEKNTLLYEKIQIKEHLANDLERITALEIEKSKLLQQLENLKIAKESVEKERDNLSMEKDVLKQKMEIEKMENRDISEKLHEEIKKLNELQELYKLEATRAQTLLIEKGLLSKDLSKEKRNNEYFLKENEQLSKNVDELRTNLNNANATTETLKVERDTAIAQKESLALTLEIEKSAREKSENEKIYLTGQINELKQAINKLRAIQKQFATDFQDTQNKFDTIKTEFEIKDLDHLIENVNLLTMEKQRLLEEKTTLIDRLSMLEKENDVLNKTLNNLEKEMQELNANYDITKNELEIKTKKYDDEYLILQNNLQGAEKLNSNILTVLNTSLNNLSDKLNHDIFNDCDSLKVLLTMKSDSIENKCIIITSIAENLLKEVEYLKNVENTLKSEHLVLNNVRDILEQKEREVIELQSEVKRLEQAINESRIELTKQSENYVTSINSKVSNIQALQQENQQLHNDLNDVKVQLEVKVHSLKEKLVDNENLTDKLKATYESQIDNLNLMVTKLTNYLKEKTVEIETMRKDKENLQQTIEDCGKVIKTLTEELKIEKHNIDKIVSEFESERLVLKNMVTVTESVMEDQKISLNNIISEHLKAKEVLIENNNELTNNLKEIEAKLNSLEVVNGFLLTMLRRERDMKQHVENESEILREYVDEVIKEVKKERNVIELLETGKIELLADVEKYKTDLEVFKRSQEENKHKLLSEIESLNNQLTIIQKEKLNLETELKEKTQRVADLENIGEELRIKLINLEKEKQELIEDKNVYIDKLEEINQVNVVKDNEIIDRLQNENKQLIEAAAESKAVIKNLEQLIKHELEQNDKLREQADQDKQSLVNKCTILQEYHNKAEVLLEERMKEINVLKKEIAEMRANTEQCEGDSKAKDSIISKMTKEKDAIITALSKELAEEKSLRQKKEKEAGSLFNELKNNMEVRRALMRENDQLTQAVGQQETYAALCHEKAGGGEKYPYPAERRDIQVDNTSSDTHSSVDSLKTITDLEKIIHDKNRTITTLQSDITYLKTMMAESETKLLDVNKELEVTKENCQQLSAQLKKIVYQKNEEIAELKKQVCKMSATETRATQIIKVSAKYQAMILKRIAEIKSNTILKELTNFGNTNASDSDLRRSLNAGTITMEELENFLDTTDRHIKRCAEKQMALQKERDRLTEVNRINESEIINLKKFLNELSLSFQTFSSIKNLYAQKLSRVVSVQRTVRREILNLEGRVTDATLCKLERGYAAVMQDLSECAMNLERWVERCISRTVSVEKIKQAFTSESERSSLASPSFQNTGLEIQLDELEKSFQRLMEEVTGAARGEAARDTAASTVMEVRAQYEDKLNRMKAKMKELLNEQMSVLKDKQRSEIALLERELQKTRDKMEAAKKGYEDHIRELTKELWNYGEKYLVKNDEAEWLKRKHHTGSLMSLQHVHSGGLMPLQEFPSRPSDTHSLRSLPVTNPGNTKKREGRGLHMSDEEGEVFDNRCLKELATPRREAPPGQRLSELRWRNSLCPPHLKSSYPAETQFAPAVDEDEIKAGSLSGVAVGKPQRKEVGITAYKKPGPPTPSKQAGRLSATDSELRESLRVENDPHPERKTSTPARIRAFLSFKSRDRDTVEGTPRARRLSNIFRKK